MVSHLRKVGVGIVGAGDVGYVHALAYKSVANAELVAVSDVSEERARKLAKTFGISKWHTDYRSLLKEPAIEAVDICTPNYLHASMTIDSVEAGKNVAVQKPMALNVKECQDMTRAAAKAGVKLTLEESDIFLQPTYEAKQLVEKSEIGEPYMIHLTHIFGSPGPGGPWAMMFKDEASLVSALGWRGEVEKAGGGGMADDGWHNLAVARHFLGDPSEVFAYLKTPLDAFELPAVIMWRCKKEGRYGVIRRIREENVYIFSEERGPLSSMIEINGSDGIIWINRGSEGRLLRSPPLVLHRGKYPGETVAFDNIDDTYTSAFKNMKSHWINCILEDREPLLTGEDGVSIMRFLLAAYKSAKDGTPVKPESITDWDWKQYFRGMRKTQE
jgi:UDP-N-acetylglucosamine 3-dehydrogenase